jgi:hypothetical protein
MPTSPTEIPHLAFTHHRIAVHRPQAAPAAFARVPAGLRAFTDLSRFPEIDRQRSRGLAHVEAANRAASAARGRGHIMQGLDLLSAASSAGLNDPAVDTTLARVRFDLGLAGVLPLADSALRHPDFVGQDRCTALFLRADALAAAGNHADALVALRELTQLQRHSTHWLLTADCERRLGNEAAWADALTTAVKITPRLWKVHQALAEYHARKGSADRAAWHRARAVQ